MLESTSLRERQAIETLSAGAEEPGWLLHQRLEAWRLYEDMMPPTGTDEDWRRTDLTALNLDGMRLFPEAGARPAISRRNGRGYAGEIVQRDGITLSSALSADAEQRGVLFGDLHSAAREHPELFRSYFMTEAVQPAAWKFVALHAALWRGGVFLYVPAGFQTAMSLHAVVEMGRSAGATVFPHTLIIAEEGSSITLVEEHISFGGSRPSLSDGVVEILVRDGATVRYVGVQDWGKNVNSFSTVRAILGANSRIEMGLVSFGGRIVKDNVVATLAAPGANAKMVGMFLAGGEQQMNYSTLQDHRAPNTTSDLLFKSVLKDSARLVWNGLTRIHKGASDSDANQSSRNLLLGENARVAPVPVLEIEAHDVTRCSHGATVSSVDEEQLYYMMSRGLTRRDATQAIVDGFLRQGLESLSVARADGAVGKVLARRLLSKAA